MELRCISLARAYLFQSHVMGLGSEITGARGGACLSHWLRLSGSMVDEMRMIVFLFICFLGLAGKLLMLSGSLGGVTTRVVCLVLVWDALIL